MGGLDVREIKFRTWVIDNKKMLHGRNAMAIKRFTPNYGHTDNEVVVMQYAGLMDKNSVEIFEGDILRLRNGQLTEVFFQSGSFVISKLTTVSLHDKKKANITHLLCNESLDSAIVGNIYEHPELLETK